MKLNHVNWMQITGAEVSRISFKKIKIDLRASWIRCTLDTTFFEDSDDAAVTSEGISVNVKHCDTDADYIQGSGFGGDELLYYSKQDCRASYILEGGNYLYQTRSSSSQHSSA